MAAEYKWEESCPQSRGETIEEAYRRYFDVGAADSSAIKERKTQAAVNCFFGRLRYAKKILNGEVPGIRTVDRGHLFAIQLAAWWMLYNKESSDDINYLFEKLKEDYDAVIGLDSYLLREFPFGSLLSRRDRRDGRFPYANVLKNYKNYAMHEWRPVGYEERVVIPTADSAVSWRASVPASAGPASAVGPVSWRRDYSASPTIASAAPWKRGITYVAPRRTRRRQQRRRSKN